MRSKVKTITAILFFSASPWLGWSQFYHGMYQDYGKNRIQYEQFTWLKYEFKDFTVYYYGEGKNLAVFTARHADEMITEIEQFFGYPVRKERLQFVVYQKIEQFRQSNVGIPETSESNIGGITQIADNKIFVYFEGDLNQMRNQIRKGIADVLISQMLFGDNWREMIKNNTLLNFPNWYVEGLTSFAAEPWSVDADDRLRDLVLRNKYKNFNRLKGYDAEIAGTSIWYYIAETYGTNVIPNIMYMARVSRNVESGFLFVLGISMNTLLNDAHNYFTNRYERDIEGTEEFKDFLNIKTKRRKDYTEIKLDQGGNKLAFASNELGKVRVYTYDFATKKCKKIMKYGHKLDRIDDFSYPLLAWNNATGKLVLIKEKKGRLWLYQLDLSQNKKVKTEVLRIEKILEMQVSPDGKQIIMSVINKGQTDILLYSIAANNYKQLTDDIFDDRYPSFAGVDRVIFSSNRATDTLGIADSYIKENPTKYYDLYSLPLDGKAKVARRLTNSPTANETYGFETGKNKLIFLSDESGIKNMLSGYIDSTIVAIDTAIRYRYFTQTEPLTAYPRNIREMNYATTAKEAIDIFYVNGKYRLQKNSLSAKLPRVIAPNSGFISDKNNLDESHFTQRVPLEPALDTNEFTFVLIKVFEESVIEPPKNGELIDINNYTFEQGADSLAKVIAKQKATKQDSIQDSRPALFQVPEQRNYKLAFAATDLTTQMDFGYTTDMYQPFNGGPFIMPGMGTFVKIGMLDVFEDYKIEGGFRLSFSRLVNEVFLSINNRSKRLDKKYIVQRISLADQNNIFNLKKTIMYQVKGVFRYPFSETQCLQGTVSMRYDKKVTLAASQNELLAPDELNYWLGMKLEYIFDNTFSKSLNIYNGTRAKIFAEHYRDIIDPNTDFSVVGLDARHYQKIHRDLIWANRLAASSSFGSRKLVYYLGGVDNWVVLSNPDPRFDRTTNIAQDQGYAFQTLATNMRGFKQNARNGNNMVVFNSEIRWPIVRYFTDRPIKSEFLANIQVVGFGDFGTAWNGPNPYSDENAFNSIIEQTPAVKVTYRNQNDPFIGGVGYGARSKIWGYFVRFDRAWGIENGLFLKPMSYFSVGMDF